MAYLGHKPLSEALNKGNPLARAQVTFGAKRPQGTVINPDDPLHGAMQNLYQKLGPEKMLEELERIRKEED